MKTPMLFEMSCTEIFSLVKIKKNGEIKYSFCNKYCDQDPVLLTEDEYKQLLLEMNEVLNDEAEE